MKMPYFKDHRITAEQDGQKLTVSIRDGRIPKTETSVLRMCGWLIRHGLERSAFNAAEYAGWELYRAGQKWRVRLLIRKGKK